MYPFDAFAVAMRAVCRYGANVLKGSTHLVAWQCMSVGFACRCCTSLVHVIACLHLSCA